MKMKFCLFIFLLMALNGLGKDTLRVDSEISIETRGQHNLAAITESKECIHCPSGTIADNPFFHNAIYTGIHYELILNNRYRIETGLYLEERSHSGGNNTLSNWVVFPKILMEVNDTFKIFNQQIGVHIIGGDFWDEDVEDMLRLYNIDYQGLLGSMHFGKWDISAMTIGDLSQNIGLDLHQTYRLGLGYRHRNWRNVTFMTLNEIFDAPRGNHPTKTDVNVSNYTKYYISEKFNVEGQFEIRANPELPTGVATGLKANYVIENLAVSSAIRFYSSDFNFGYNGNKPRYFGLDGSYVGPQLYPLKNYYRNFSQWAVYTHRPNSDILTLELTASWNRNVYKKMSIFCDIDMNLLFDLRSKESTIYPIYHGGMKIEFVKNFSGIISLTNKHMELREGYQTFSVSKLPYLSLGVQLDLDKMRLKTVYIKS